MRLVRGVVGSVSLALLAGCHSHYVEATISNASPGVVTVVQVEYPSASFGVQMLQPGQVFHYRFKVYGSKPIALSYFDAKTKEHHQTGPVLREGDEGRLQITVRSDHADFEMRLQR